MDKIKKVPTKLILTSSISALLGTIFIGGALIALLVIFWQPEAIEEKGVRVLDVPPAPLGQGFDRQFSETVYSTIYPLPIWQNPPIEKIIPSILKAFQIDYIVLWIDQYRNFFEAFLEEIEYVFSPQLRKVNKEALKNYDLLPFFSQGQGWYEAEEDERGPFVWMGERATFYYYLPEKISYIIRPALISIKGGPTGYLGPETKLYLTLNDQKARTIVLNKGEVQLLLINLKMGLNAITLESEKGCIVPEELDERCLSFNIRQIAISLLP